MFKLTRMSDLRKSGNKRAERDVPEYVCDKLRHTKGEIHTVIKFDPSVKWRLIDEYGAEFFTEEESGSLIMDLTWADIDSLYMWVLTFGDKAEIISPENFRRDFSELVRRISEKYSDG